MSPPITDSEAVTLARFPEFFDPAFEELREATKAVGPSAAHLVEALDKTYEELCEKAADAESRTRLVDDRRPFPGQADPIQGAEAAVAQDPPPFDVSRMQGAMRAACRDAILRCVDGLEDVLGRNGVPARRVTANPLAEAAQIRSTEAVPRGAPGSPSRAAVKTPAPAPHVNGKRL